MTKETKRDMIILACRHIENFTEERVESLWNAQEHTTKFLGIEKPDLGSFDTQEYLRNNFQHMAGVMFMDEEQFFARGEEIPVELRKKRKLFTPAIIHSMIG